MVNFLDAQPLVELREYPLEDSGCLLNFNAFWDIGVRIEAEEYQAAIAVGHFSSLSAVDQWPTAIAHYLMASPESALGYDPIISTSLTTEDSQPS